MSNKSTENNMKNVVSISGSDRLDELMSALLKELVLQSNKTVGVFDTCLWELLTIPASELESFVNSRWKPEFNDLPVSFLFLIQGRLSSEISANVSQSPKIVFMAH